MSRDYLVRSGALGRLKNTTTGIEVGVLKNVEE